MVGAGGGFLSVPFMTWCNVKIHNAVATSAALGLPIAVAGTRCSGSFVAPRASFGLVSFEPPAHNGSGSAAAGFVACRMLMRRTLAKPELAA
jgi:uncharacterized membrane protein YfcA